MAKTRKEGEEVSQSEILSDAKRIMERLVTAPVELHKAMVERRKAAKAAPKRARRKK